MFRASKRSSKTAIKLFHLKLEPFVTYSLEILWEYLGEKLEVIVKARYLKEVPV
jgi:hypothetical protein